MVSTGINFSSDRLSSLSQVAVSAFASGSTLLVGLWEGRKMLELRSLDLQDTKAIKSALNGLNVKEINLIHDDGVFAHSDFDSFNPLNFDKYFSEDILAIKEDTAISSYEKLKQQKVFTLSYIPALINLTAAGLHEKTKIHHVSTAMGNYSLEKADNILVLIGDHRMSLIIQKNGFKEFLQYDLEDGYDFLYYILLAAEKHQMDITKLPVNIGGNIDISSPLYQTLKAHIYNLTFCTKEKFSCPNTDLPIHYYLPLIIARACA